MFAVIMAGGEGTRFWPRSKRSRPKQFLNIFGTGTMLQQAYNRIRPLLPPESIFVVTLTHSYREVVSQIPELPKENIILEPLGKNTAPCVGLAALVLKRRQPDAVMVVLAADHLIKDELAFRQTITLSYQVAKETGYVVTLGITPSHPETGYGYIQMGEPLRVTNIPGIFKVLRFTEKPDLKLATEFVKDGHYLWNSGMFIWRIDTLLDLIKRHHPDLDRELQEINTTLGTEKEQNAVLEAYKRLESVSIDYALMEKAQKVAVIPCNFGWNDVGNWRSLADIIEPDEYGNVVVGPFLAKDSHNCIVSSPDKLVALIGLKDFIVVTSDDAILICPKERHQEVREIVELLKAKGWAQYL